VLHATEVTGINGKLRVNPSKFTNTTKNQDEKKPPRRVVLVKLLRILHNLENA